jgi:hypothetical protein
MIHRLIIVAAAVGLVAPGHESSYSDGLTVQRRFRESMVEGQLRTPPR